MATEEEQIEEEQEDQKKPSKGGRKKIVMLVVIVLVLAGLGGGSYLGYQAMTSDDNGEDDTAEVDVVRDPEEQGEDLLVPLTGSATVNLAEPNTFIVVQIAIEIPTDLPEIEKNKLKQRELRIREQLLNLLNQRTGDELLTMAGKQELKEELLTFIDGFFDRKNVLRIKTVKWFIQRVN